ncbi:hypothetical protein [Streptomyces sp. NEAU-S7GS2]|uniref:hypothetical protein n=1 Tax=Streptomyces sp. NEAU-S7GS2 TaxID=2202000 RepID=UPI000D704BD0|nr:hypothetical protein [Streptomyces sp. NEAU-S7GS2]AWN24853.1 hypothetical protein DKG71_00485 [Streptomyces sp. NEAU-S7GS2]
MRTLVTDSHSRSKFIDTADPSWYSRVLRTLARDYPEISDKVWATAISENAVERIEEKQQ